MASVRLNKFMRETILARLMEHAFEEREKTLRADEAAFGREVYDDVYPAKIQKAMKALPEGFLPKESGLKVSFGGSFTRVWFGENRLIAKKHDYNAAEVYEAKHPFCKRQSELENRKKELKSEKRSASGSAQSVLDSVTTLKKLVEVWPECAPFVTDFEANDKTTALALPIKDLNSRLGLPPETK